jgi:penicillin amidase
MKKSHHFTIYIILASLFFLSTGCQQKKSNALLVKGLHDKVEVLRDSAGINHIYANNQHDLFFAQGYCVAHDRLFQLELWRMQATGTTAGVLGPKELKRDIGARLFQYRGDMNKEMNHYHPQGKQIINAFVDGINAYIRQANKHPDQLPFEFKLLGITPKEWTPAVVISRHQGLLYNINDELKTGQAVALAGVKEVKFLNWYHPKDADIKLDPSINGKALLNPKILELYNAFRHRVNFKKDLETALLKTPDKEKARNTLAVLDHVYTEQEVQLNMTGSNSWVINGKHTQSGSPILANDPHRTIAVPSLRYMVHLHAPGWNVIGGGEPEIPGVSIGHNQYGAWGLTVFRTDAEDLYVYQLNPKNLNEYRYKGEWKAMKIIDDTIPVKGQKAVAVQYRYTLHGPVTFIDTLHRLAYAVRCGWLEPGGSPYLASLRMDQAKSWEEYRNACSYSHIPGENMMWADKKGNIGWQAVGIAPIRKNFSGLVPVPGDGRYEWSGFLPIKQKPHIFNPGKGFFATANQNLTPKNYPHWDAIAHLWSDDYRGNRLNEVLGSGKKFSITDMEKLQTDVLSIPARQLCPMMKKLSFQNPLTKKAKNSIANWDYKLERNSVPAAIYNAWEQEIVKEAKENFVPDKMKGLVNLQLTKIIGWIQHPGKNSVFKTTNRRDAFLKKTFSIAVNQLESALGENMAGWQYGQAKYKHITIKNAFSFMLNPEMQKKANMGPAPRGGNSYTVCATSSKNNQYKGASFRIIADTKDWDNSVGTNTPGQSGNPDSKFYKNLFKSWASDHYFPLYYSKSKIETILDNRLILSPE